MLTELLIALQFLTVVRVRQDLPFSETALGRSGVFFPLIGLALGLIVWGIDIILRPFIPLPFLNVVIVFALAFFSRGLHLDGLADSADGLLGSQDRHRSLEIMKDSAIGTFGVLAVMAAVLLKLRALDLLTGSYRGSALLLSPMLGRWACVVMAYSSRPARAEGLGATFVRGVQFREFALASVFTLALVFASLEVLGLLVFLPLAALILCFTLYCNRRLGGATGDTLGALGEMVETATFCLLMVLEGTLSRG
ncbi:MAG: adenosylcobinamide-GDP ribazoletransferase [Candidatus Binatia bacterium]|nr:adenosylcobinamide-GDP ribazoletransferase [Candidatus Binatia bacterium]